MDYEDRLRVWCTALLKSMAYYNGRGLLIPLPRAVRELNAATDGPQIRAAQLERIVAEFKDISPPYPSVDPALTARAAKTQERAADRAEKHRLRLRKSRGSEVLDTRHPHMDAGSALAHIEMIRRKATPARDRGSPKHAYGYEVINGIPRWNNGGHRIPVAVAQSNNKRRLLRASRVGKVAPERDKTEPKYELLGAAEHIEHKRRA